MNPFGGTPKSLGTIEKETEEPIEIAAVRRPVQERPVKLGKCDKERQKGHGRTRRKKVTGGTENQVLLSSK